MKELDLLKGPVRKTILQFSIPTILGMAATQLYTVADTMIIGRLMDKYALGAVSNASAALMAFMFISGGLELGCGLLAASERPRLEPKDMSGLIYNMLLLDLATGLLMLAYLRRTVLTCAFQFRFLKKHCFWDILRLSAPNTLQQIAPPAVALVKQGLLGTLGVTEIGGFSCSSKLSALMMMPIYGFAQSLGVFIAQNHSAGAADRIHAGVRETRNLILAYMSAVVLSCLLLSRQMLSLFTDDPAVIQCGATLLAFESWTYMLTAMKHLQEARLRGQMKMGRYLISSLLPIGVNIACCLLLVPGFGYSGFYLSTYVSAPFSLLLAVMLVKCSRDGVGSIR